MWQVTFVVVDLLTLKLLIFSLVIAYFVAQIAPDRTNFIKIFPGGMPPDPLALVGLCIVTVNLCTCYVILFLDIKLIFMRKT